MDVASEINGDANITEAWGLKWMWHFEQIGRAILHLEPQYISLHEHDL